MMRAEDDVGYGLHELIAPSFARQPRAIALKQGSRAVSYAELDDRASRVASYLVELRLASPSLYFVGVTSAITVESVATVLGILRAGLCYVPLDALSPPARLRSVVDDAGIQVAFVDPVAYPEHAEFTAGALQTRVSLDAELTPDGYTSWLHAQARPPLAQAAASLADDLAYVLYTSGSTGVPKGVMLTHRNATTFVRWMAKAFALGPSDRVAARSPLNFDLSVFDVFDTLYAGATLLIDDERRSRDGTGRNKHRAYVQMLERERATVLYTTPSAFTVLLEKGDLSERVPLRVIMYAGEPFHPAMLARLMRALPSTRVANIYGPTETNIVTCYWVTTPPEAAVPIGKEVDDTEIFVVDAQGRQCGVDEVGELWVRGGTVCVGYLGKPELTRERSVDSPFHRFPARLWRTGDLGKRQRDGNLVCLGRADDMVKVRGYRIEIGEVERGLTALPEVAQAAVVLRPHEKYGGTLHAFVLLRGPSACTSADLLEAVRARLPAYMVPSELRIVDAFPYTSTGKIDRQRLTHERPDA